jgi:hypothetical protein
MRRRRKRFAREWKSDIRNRVTIIIWNFLNFGFSNSTVKFYHLPRYFIQKQCKGCVRSSSPPASNHRLLATKPITTIMAYRGNKRLSTKRKFVADGVFYAELNELLIAELAEEGYAGSYMCVEHTLEGFRLVCCFSLLFFGRRSGSSYDTAPYRIDHSCHSHTKCVG